MVIRSVLDLNNNHSSSESDHDPTTSSYVGGEKSGLSVKNPKKNERSGVLVIKEYQNGLLVNENFKPKDDPSTAEFLAQLQRGEVPVELESLVGRNGELSVQLVKVEADYDATTAKTAAQASKSKQHLFQGTGQSANSGPQVTEHRPVNAEAVFPVDPNRPTTVLQVRYPNGQRVSVTLNEDTTCEELLLFVRSVSNDPEVSIFAGFPPKPIETGSATIKSAGLCNSAVTVRKL
jgi:SEP domain/UBX domain